MSDPAPTSASSVERGAPSGVEVVVSHVLTAGLAVLALVVGALAMLFAMASDACFGHPSDPRICSDSGGVIFFVGLFGLWLVLAVAVLGAFAMIVLGRQRRRRVWFWPFAGLGVGLAGCLAYLGVVAYLSA